MLSGAQVYNSTLFSKLLFRISFLEDRVYKTDKRERAFTLQPRVGSRSQGEEGRALGAESGVKCSLSHLVISSVPRGSFLDLTSSPKWDNTVHLLESLWVLRTCI